LEEPVGKLIQLNFHASQSCWRSRWNGRISFGIELVVLKPGVEKKALDLVAVKKKTSQSLTHTYCKKRILCGKKSRGEKKYPVSFAAGKETGNQSHLVCIIVHKTEFSR
jgi:hypothetical protein